MRHPLQRPDDDLALGEDGPRGGVGEGSEQRILVHLLPQEGQRLRHVRLAGGFRGRNYDGDGGRQRLLLAA